MKKTIKHAIALVIAAVICLSVLPATVVANQPGDDLDFYMWQAVNEGLVPDNLWHSHTGALRRAEFAALAVVLYETVSGAEISGRVTFSDTNDVNVEKMAYLGVVTGNGDGTFSPNGLVSREQVAVMLARLALFIGVALPVQAPTFSDAADISPWAFSAVGQMQAAGLMTPVSGNEFAPANVFSRQQGIVTMLWLREISTYGARRLVVHLGHNNITNAQLEAMVASGEIPRNVTHLHLSSNQISNVAPLASLRNLNTLELASNRISDISPLAVLPRLTSLNISWNRISNIAPLANFSPLTSLYLSGNYYTTIAPLRYLTNLTSLTLGGSFEFDGDVSHLGGLVNLARLTIENSWLHGITNFAAIGNLVNLRSLSLGNATHLTNVLFLQNLTNLTNLSIHGSPIVDFSPIRHLYALESLDLQSNGIRDLSHIGLDRLTNLTSLGLWNNYITDVSALAGLTNLAFLTLGRNHISDISPLSGLTNLWSLWLDGNQISDISVLHSMDNLQHLSIQGNPLRVYQIERLLEAFPNAHITY